MRYWVYINDKVDGPYDEDKLAVLDGFTPDTLICSEEIEEGGSQEWVKASSVFEFDEATQTMTHAPLTQNELTPAPEAEDTAQHTATAQPAGTLDASAAQILIEKIDYLTKEIESLKGKLDEALAARPAEPAQPHMSAAAAQPAVAEAATTQTLPTEPITEDAPITDTESLVTHAEQLVAQASASTTEKPVDFLDEIQIGATKTGTLAEKGGEEVVLRSALDSLYSTKPAEQTEQEKETTFQDLLSSAKVITEPNMAAQPETAAKQEAQPAQKEQVTAQQPLPQTQPAEQPAEQEPAEAKEQAVLPQALTEQAPAAEPVSQEKREEIINEITAPAQQDNLILQAISEAQKEDEGVKLPEENQPQEKAAIESVQETAASEQQADLPSLDNQPQQDEEQEPKEKESLDLTDQPQLNIVNEEPAAQPQPAEQPQAAPVPDLASVSDMVTPMDPAEENAGSQQKEITETIKELVPGKKIEAPKEEGLISQADLDEAFSERKVSTTEDFPLPEDNPAPAAQEQAPQEAPAEATGSLPEGKGFYNPNDMTEVELKEGSTYLISDFIPPAVASDKKAVPNAYGAVPGSAEAAQAEAQTKSGDKPQVEVQPLTESVEEIVAEQKPDQADLTVSKVILENTIKTKRGATMDIKTVPMVNEPADSNRLDLSDADFADINTQHDLKAADAKPGSKKATKMVLGTLVSVILLALIYVMLAYLEIIPAQFNFIKAAPAAQQMQNDQLDEMLGDMPAADAQPAGTQPLPDLQGQQPLPQQGVPQQGYVPGQLPQGAAQQMQGQALPGQMMPVQGQPNPMDAILTEVKNFPLANGQTLQQLINSRHPAAVNLIEWTISTAVEPDNYSILVKVPPENPQSFKIPYRFNYNTVTKTLEPTISDSKNLLDSIKAPQAAR